jgi:hypothetical protein
MRSAVVLLTFKAEYLRFDIQLFISARANYEKICYNIKNSIFSNLFTAFQNFVDCIYEGPFRLSKKEVRYGASSQIEIHDERRADR